MIVIITQQVIGTVVSIEDADTTATGVPVLKVNVAVNKRGYKTKEDITFWVNAKAYGATASFIRDNDPVGRRIFMNGEIDFWDYNSKIYNCLNISSARFMDKKDQSNLQGPDIGTINKVGKKEEVFEVSDDLPF